MSEDHLRVLVVGAHPDDCDIRAGGTAIQYADAGHDVRFLSVTNGDAGHHEMAGIELVRRRRAEAQEAADVAGIEYEVLDNHDGELEPTLENRTEIIREIRRFDPDVLFTHRPNDYHPDHRYTSRLVRDAAYMVTVPNVCPDTTALRTDPVIAYVYDSFERPYPFTPDVVVPTDTVVDRKFDMLDCHESQVYEWLPYNQGKLDEVPQSEEERRAWLATRPLSGLDEMAGVADRFRTHLVERYGEERGRAIEFAEAFEASEYGSPLTDENVERLFPFY